MKNERYLILSRKKKIAGSFVPYNINIDGQWVAQLKNGQTINIPLDYSEHKMYIRADFSGNNVFSEGLTIGAGSVNHHLHCYHKTLLTSVIVTWDVDQEQEAYNAELLKQQYIETNIQNEIRNVLYPELDKKIGFRNFSVLNKLSSATRTSKIFASTIETVK